MKMEKPHIVYLISIMYERQEILQIHTQIHEHMPFKYLSFNIISLMNDDMKRYVLTGSVGENLCALNCSYIHLI